MKITMGKCTQTLDMYGSFTKNIVSIHESNTLPFVFVIHYWSCWIPMQYLQKYASWVCI